MTTSNVPRSSDGTRFAQSFWTNSARTPSSSRDRVGDLHLEADEVPGLGRIVVDVRLAALDVAAPPQHARGAHPRERRSLLRRRAGEERRREDQQDEDGGAADATGSRTDLPRCELILSRRGKNSGTTAGILRDVGDTSMDLIRSADGASTGLLTRSREPLLETRRCSSWGRPNEDRPRHGTACARGRVQARGARRPGVSRHTYSASSRRRTARHLDASVGTGSSAARPTCWAVACSAQPSSAGNRARANISASA